MSTSPSPSRRPDPALGDRLADPRASPEHWLDEIDPAILGRIAAALPGERDRRVLALIAEGERQMEAFAEVLGLDGRPLPEQRREVKRAKDRVLKRVQRQLRKEPDA
jgi:hypothetical protein